MDGEPLEHLSPDEGSADALVLTPEEIRVLGCLVEKSRTTPDDYPLSANATMRAANQSTSRDPVVDYDPATVDAALVSLKAAGLVRFVHAPSGRIATRYRHVMGERLGLGDAAVAALGLLMLRGPQTAGELKTRSDRWQAFGTLDDVTVALEELAAATPPLAVLTERRPGQKEARWAHLLSGAPDERATTEDGSSGGARGSSVSDRVARLEADVARLSEELDELRRSLGG